LRITVCSPRFEAAKEKDEPPDDEAQEMQRTKKKEKKSVAKKKPQQKGKEKTKPQKRRRSSATRRSGSDADGEWREAWKKGGSAKAKSDYSDGEDNGEEDGESGYESSKSVRDELTDDESFSSSESTSSSSSAPSSGIKKKGKAILEFISRDRIKRDDEAEGEPHRPSWLWRKGSREKVTERDNVITSTAADMDDLSLYDRESLNNSQQSPRVRCLPHAMALTMVNTG
jgi:hypothetical protein